MIDERWLLMPWHAGFVFTLRSLQLWTEPVHAGHRLLAHAEEKRRAMLQGMVGVTRAVVEGATPMAMMQAAFEPARRRVAANARGMARRPR